jgi:hypothetical protein
MLCFISELAPRSQQRQQNAGGLQADCPHNARRGSVQGWSGLVTNEREGIETSEWADDSFEANANQGSLPGVSGDLR